MLLIDRPERIIPKQELFNNQTQEFITIEERRLKPVHLQLEHSLMSIAKWESKWHVSFLGKDDMSEEEFRDYIRCMTINAQKDSDVYNWLLPEDLMEIAKYMEDPNSAWEITKPKDDKKNKKKKRKLDTVEKIYFGMIQYGIPMECEKWHFNRLIALMDYCDKQGGSSPGGGSPVKRSQKEIMEMYRALNEKNRKKYHSNG